MCQLFGIIRLRGNFWAKIALNSGDISSFNFLVSQKIFLYAFWANIISFSCRWVSGACESLIFFKKWPSLYGEWKFFPLQNGILFLNLNKMIENKTSIHQSKNFYSIFRLAKTPHIQLFYFHHSFPFIYYLDWMLTS